MTDRADRDLAEQFLEGRLHALARGVSVPAVPAGEDVRRGRRRLLRLRLAMAGGTTATLAVVLGITGLTAGDPTATEVPPMTQLTTSLPADPTTSPADEDRASGPSKGNGGDKVGQGGPPASEPTGTPESSDTADSTRLPGVPVATHGVAGGGSGGGSGTGPHGGATVGPGHGHPSASDPTSAPTSSAPTPTPTPTATPTTLPTDTVPTDPPTSPPADPGPIRLPQVLRAYNGVLAEHLDPEREHLQPYDRKTDDKETTKSGGRLFALGSTFRWADGRSLGGLQVTVASGWDQVDWECGASYTDWACHPSGVAEVAVHDGVRQVAVEHGDGQVVVLTADPTYDAGSRAVSAGEPTEEELVAAVADDRLTLPGDAPVSPPQLASETFASAGVAALVAGEDETFTQTSIDRTPEVKGTWSVADAARGTVSWSARPVYSGGGWQCSKTYRSCTDLVVDQLGHTVHVAHLKKKLGGGWVIEYAGPQYAVRVYATDPKFPKKRAYAFVTDDAWQPAR
jgi:hypothetical protein